MNELPERRAFSVPEAASLMGIGRSTVYQLVQSGKLRSVQFGRRRLIPLSALEELGFGASAPRGSASAGTQASTTSETIILSKIELLETASKAASALSRYLATLAQEQRGVLRTARPRRSS